ncbi:hypothetical protein B0A50_08144 [Salinomyces thailandicus]|uniref:Zn(2)-C6 fungal-type domain-containing protein n=1 Tax=Salinomyces thailandicus TaxID=706561 RepID=A0A4U0TL31_9PEZI|nr:hypothetical protein B0A50_08144 [Salinomyces thailandica]
MSSTKQQRARACDHCHSIKIKCELGSTAGPPPCQRCVRLNKDCIVTPPKRQKDRVAELEAKVQSLTRLLEAQGLSTGVSSSVDDDETAHEEAAPPPPINDNTSSKKRRLETTTAAERPSAVAIGGSTTSRLDRVVPVHLQSRILSRYIHDVYPHFPILPIPADHGLEIMRSTRPKLLHAIIYAGSTGFLTLEDQEEVAKLLLLDEMTDAGASSPKSLEVLQALLIACLWWWAPKHYKHVAIHQLIEAVADIARDIGIASDPAIPQAGLHRPTGETTQEDYEASATWRAWLMSYLLTAAWSTYQRGPLKETWTLRHDECLMMLEYSPHALHSDRLLAQYIRAESVCAKIAFELSFADPTVCLDISSPTTQAKMHQLQNSVLDWHAQVPASLRTEPALMLWQHVAALYVHEPVLHTANNKATFTAPYVAGRLSITDFPAPPAGPSHADALAALRYAAHSLIDIYCSMELGVIMALPGMLYPPRILYAIYLLVKAYIACTAIGNTYGSVLLAESLQLDVYFAKVADLAARCRAVDERAAPGTLLASASRMQEFYCNYKDTLASVALPAYSMAEVGAVDSVEANSFVWDDLLLMSEDNLPDGDFGFYDFFATAGQPGYENEALFG